MNISNASERLIITLWVGGLWAIGFLAVPLAFIKLDDPMIAGDYAGQLFYAMNIIGLASGLALLLIFFIRRTTTSSSWRLWLVLAMLALTALFHFYIQPEMAAIKMLDWRNDAELSQQFDQLHNLSSKIYFVICVLGLALVVSDSNKKSISTYG